MVHTEQLSALLDGELDDQDLDAVIRNLDDDALQTWHLLNTVGDVMRSSELVAHHSPSFLKRFEVELSKEATVLAPALAAHWSQRMVQRLSRTSSTRRMVASAAAVAVFSFAMYQAVPPLERSVQMVRTTPVQTVSDQDLALWQEYFMAHQQNSLRSGLSGVSPIARVEAERPQLNTVSQVNVGTPDGLDWMNVWQPSDDAWMDSSSVRFNYVSAGR
ncbi:sigma-E factor negative regulatory protein [Limnobacter humi]|uniref:Sigma-E factor negative regulatory protein n=1 Tax=Limnobacter humi TaxID=1778671 RepID=A0ABT1WHL3_9BURK|nr:sigma-E factor negative regulatory protein [Limnobacter humi]MCQ8895929.1 sigma-E factor negative regulatory protein [Limnobacter humi]